MFVACPPDPACPFCCGAKPRPDPRGAFEAVYCINVVEQPKRFADMQRLFHAEGLCGLATFNRPARGRHSTTAIWTSHRDVAREAARRGQNRVLVLEDDVRFLAPWPGILEATQRAIAKLPADWRALYLGHLPLQSFFVGWGVLRTSSSTAHAYVANRPLIDWLCATEPMAPYIPLRSVLIGRGVDSAFACLPGMYALFPSRIAQKRVEEVRLDDHRGPRKWTDPARYRLSLIIEARAAHEGIAAILSPLHWAMMKLPHRTFQPPPAVRQDIVRRFDRDFYLEKNPDVAASGRDPFEHFLADGAREGRNPNAEFDMIWYRETYGLRPRARPNAFEHYVWFGRAQGNRPNGRSPEPDIREIPPLPSDSPGDPATSSSPPMTSS